MRRFGHIFVQVRDFHALRRAARRALRGTRLGADSAAFLVDLEPQVLALQRELDAGTYRPGPYRTFRIRDPKPRTISAAPFRDRVVHHALCAALEPVFERYASDHSYACRRGRGTRAALVRTCALARRSAYFLKLDVEHCFESIDHALLDTQLCSLVKDQRVLALTRSFIEAGAPGSPPGKGLPIGNLTSQHFANLHLGKIDHLVHGTLQMGDWCRYMDDMLLFADDRGRLLDAWRRIDDFVAARMALRLRADACAIGRVADGVPFLGFRIWPGTVRLDRPRRLRLGRRLHRLLRAGRDGHLSAEALLPALEATIAWARIADATGLLRSLMQRLERDGLIAPPQPAGVDLALNRRRSPAAESEPPARPSSRDLETGAASPSGLPARPGASALRSHRMAARRRLGDDGHNLCPDAASLETAHRAPP